MPEVDADTLNALVGKMLGDLGGAFSVPTVRIGFRLGLFAALHQHGPSNTTELAERCGLAERYVREWALAQATNGYVTHDAVEDRFSLSAEQAMVFALKDSPVYLEGAFDLAAAMLDAQPKVEAAFRSGGGVAWGESAGCLFCAVGSFFRPGYVNSIVPAWLPALDGILPRLTAGARVADIGCGVGFSTLMMAEAFPNSTFTGYDFHPPSIAQANAHAAAHGLSGRVTFKAVAAKEIADTAFDLVTMFDCLHDMGDPRGCAAHVRELLKPDGTWMLVEPAAADRAGDNIGNPVSRLYYNASTMICVPTSLAQEVGEALGAQAGEARLTALVQEAGFRRVRRAATGPFNMVLQACP
ncbi:class I SAM-dependent methyltransferase [Methylobacterium frigidaeris]|uniref:Ubiquinone biosynthesis O-methyltransferase, mitochondrial n=1 Tax=Methylobacterium frigidaeris TaxID=2038277 RepID=A0AA37HIC1_9HYPH|nr:class I SAM-dependent methyltransferase [Methylobacterium frigidaeris]GJD66515.1 Ubiquinone biosynthesis O-methyltransferase, mitochondrial [Methylobacterium frigidaeris]